MTRSSRRNANDHAKRLSKEDWVVAALRQVSEGGVASVRVESLARDLKVTKGSFYWHFKDREALLVEMLRYWQENLTSRIAAFAKKQISDPKERLLFLLRVASEERADIPGGAMEHALREWARSSDVARRAISDVDNERTTFVADVYMQMGMTKQKASAAALLAMSHLVGINIIQRDIGLQAFRMQREICIDFLLRLPELAD